MTKHYLQLPQSGSIDVTIDSMRQTFFLYFLIVPVICFLFFFFFKCIFFLYVSFVFFFLLICLAVQSNLTSEICCDNKNPNLNQQQI